MLPNCLLLFTLWKLFVFPYALARAKKSTIIEGYKNWHLNSIVYIFNINSISIARNKNKINLQF